MFTCEITIINKRNINNENTFLNSMGFNCGITCNRSDDMFTFMAPLMGFDMNIPRMLAGTMNTPISVGWIAHSMVGEVLAINFAAIFLQKVNKDSTFKSGALFGLIPCLLRKLMMVQL